MIAGAILADCFVWQGTGGAPDFDWLRDEMFVEVAKYLNHYSAQAYLRVIETASLRGYTLLLHEWVEIETMKSLGADPLDITEQTAHFGPTHAKALLCEHRLLQAAAWSEGLSFSLRELVENNPHGDPPDPIAGWSGDWHVLRKYSPDCLSLDDTRADPTHARRVREFYCRHKFEEVRHDA